MNDHSLAECTLRARIVATIARNTVAFVWCYHGLIPKLLVPDPNEFLMTERMGCPAEYAVFVTRAAAVVEILLAIVIVARPRDKWPLYLTIFLMLVAFVGVALGMPELLTEAFNPVTLNQLVIAMCAIALVADADSNPKDRQ